jgi:recombination protein RecA
VGVELEIVKKAGAWFTYEGEQLGQGRENSRQFLQEHKDIALEIERKVLEAVGLSKFNEDDEKPVVLEDVAPPAPELTEQEAKLLDEKVEKAKAKATAG